MATGVPGFFTRKYRTPIPPGVDVTFVTDVRSTSVNYLDFIADPLLFQGLEAALIAEGVGTTENNRYSFGVGVPTGTVSVVAVEGQYKVDVNGTEQRWALGSDVSADTVVYPTYTTTPGVSSNVSTSANLLFQEPFIAGDPRYDRDYNPLAEQILISASFGGIEPLSFDQPSYFPYRYIALAPALLQVGTASPNPRPPGTLVGLIYTTAAEGVAIFIDGSTIYYQTEVPTSDMFVALGVLSEDIRQQLVSTNGAVYAVQEFQSAERLALFGESLGTVLGKYLYETA